MRGWLTQVWAILDKELRIEWRTKSTLIGMGVFGVLVLFIGHFAFPPERRQTLDVVPGVLWIGILFANLLGLTRTMARERENGCLEAQLLSPVDRGAMYVGKLTANFIFLLGVEVLMFAASALFFNVDYTVALGGIVSVVLLGTLGLATLGTLLGAMAVETRLAEILLALMMTPLALPILISAVKATNLLLTGGTIEASFWIQLLMGADAIYLALAFALYGQVVDA